MVCVILDVLSGLCHPWCPQWFVSSLLSSVVCVILVILGGLSHPCHPQWFVSSLSSSVVCVFLVILSGLYHPCHPQWFVSSLSSSVVCVILVVLSGLCHPEGVKSSLMSSVILFSPKLRLDLWTNTLSCSPPHLHPPTHPIVTTVNIKFPPE